MTDLRTRLRELADEIHSLYVNAHVTENTALIHCEHKLRDLLATAERAEPAAEGERCPDCGYTQQDARVQGDHRLCPRYPFFADEQPTGA